VPKSTHESRQITTPEPVRGGHTVAAYTMLA